MSETKKWIAVITDGVGMAKPSIGNAVDLANIPMMKSHWGPNIFANEYRTVSTISRLLEASGTAVGLPEGVMGNSEQGHSTAFSGCAYKEPASFIPYDIANGSFFRKPAWETLVAPGQDNGTVHFVGLLSDGNCHSDINHLFEMIRKCAKQGVKKLRVWGLLDGRDVAPHSAQDYVSQLEDLLKELSLGNEVMDYRLAMVAGRMTSLMDRDDKWERVQRVWDAMFNKQSELCQSALEAIEELRGEAELEQGEYTDADLGLRLIAEEDGSVPSIQTGDSLLLFNFRTDRISRFMSWMLEQPLTEAAVAQGVERSTLPGGIDFVVMTNFDPENLPVKSYFYEGIAFKDTLVDFLGKHNKRIFHTSGPTKGAHVTTFTNKRSKSKPEHCTWRILESDQEEPLGLEADMRMHEIRSEVVEAIKADGHDLIIVNLMAPDMVGHEGNVDHTIAAVEATEKELKGIIEAAMLAGYGVMYVGDHGNAEVLIALDDDGNVPTEGEQNAHTAHTTNPVRCNFVFPTEEECAQTVSRDIEDPSLANITATIAWLMGLPEESFPGHWQPPMFERRC